MDATAPQPASNGFIHDTDWGEVPRVLLISNGMKQGIQEWISEELPYYGYSVHHAASLKEAENLLKNTKKDTPQDAPYQAVIYENSEHDQAAIAKLLRLVSKYSHPDKTSILLRAEADNRADHHVSVPFSMIFDFAKFVIEACPSKCNPMELHKLLEKADKEQELRRKMRGRVQLREDAEIRVTPTAPATAQAV